MLNLVDYFGGTQLVFALALFEITSIFWVYGNFFLVLQLQCNTDLSVLIPKESKTSAGISST